MRLLHTSDWHLGRTLHGVDLLDHQAAYLDHLVELTRSERVDAVVVAGDVYDRAIPPVDAVTLLSDALARLAEHTTVVVTSGNHDSATRLGFGAALMRDRVRVRTRVAGIDEPVVVRGEASDERLLVYGVPYLDPDAARDDATLRGDADAPRLARSHEAVMSAALRRVRADLDRRTPAGPGTRSVVVAHAFVTGAAASESERDIRVGGVDQVPATVFAGADYVALGHLHGPQVVGGVDGTLVRYAGSPLAYSFSEQHQHKSTALVDLAPDEPVVELVPAPVPRRLSDVTGPLDELLGTAGERYVDDWVRVTVTDAVRPQDLYRRVRERFSHALVVQHRAPEGAAAPGRRTTEITATQDPLEVAADFVRHVTGTAATDDEREVLRRAYERVTAGERSA